MLGYKGVHIDRATYMYTVYEKQSREYLGILQENTLKRLQGNSIKTVMGIGKTCGIRPLLKALNLSHIPSIEL